MLLKVPGFGRAGFSLAAGMTANPVCRPCMPCDSPYGSLRMGVHQGPELLRINMSNKPITSMSSERSLLVHRAIRRFDRL